MFVDAARLGFVRVEKGGNSCENERFLFFFLGALTAGKNYRLELAVSNGLKGALNLGCKQTKS